MQSEHDVTPRVWDAVPGRGRARSGQVTRVARLSYLVVVAVVALGVVHLFAV